MATPAFLTGSRWQKWESARVAPFCMLPAISVRRAGHGCTSACSRADVRPVEPLGLCLLRASYRNPPGLYAFIVAVVCVYWKPMETVTQGKPITRRKQPRNALPVLVPISKSQMEWRKKAGIIDAEEGYFYEDVSKTVPVRFVSEVLGTLSTSERWITFEAKYGFNIQERERKNLFFMLMLTKAIEGRDPNRGVREALRYYRGDQPQGLFRAGGPV